MSEFFEQLQKHSDAKVSILNNYFVPWLRKINLGFNGGRCLVIDGFAGPGIYEDGSEGSPFKLLRASLDFYEQCERNDWKIPSITLLFIEGDKKNYNSLRENISNTFEGQFDEDGNFSFEEYPSVKVICINDNFQNAFRAILEGIKPHRTLIPSFCFVDPFGYKDTPFELFEKYLSNEKAELLFNFMFEEINRFVTTKNSPKLMETYSKLFGVASIEELQLLIGDNKKEERKNIVVDYYSRQLLTNTEAKHVLNFEFKKNGRTKMFLFYATKNKIGLQLMKQQMWKIDDTGLYLFDDRKRADQIQFEFVKDMEDDKIREDLSIILAAVFSGKKVSIELIQDFTLTETIYPIENYMKPALKILERQGIIDVSRRKRAFSYPAGCLITFL